MHVEILIFLLLMTDATCTSVSGCHTSYSAAYQGNVTDCQRQNLTQVPSDLPKDIVGLDLQNNLLTRISNNSFSALRDLRFLYLSANPLNTLQRDAFKGLGKLEALKMSCDTLSLDKTTYPDGLFEYLVSLRQLVLLGSINNEGQFPTDIVQGLHSLEKLYINSWPKDGKWPQLEQLKDTLTLLNINTIGIPVIGNTTFQALRDIPLKILNFNGVVRNIEAGAFCPFKNLTNLLIGLSHGSTTKFVSITRALRCLAGRHMEEIILSRVVTTGETSVTLTKEMFGYLADICVKKLDVSRNKITQVDDNAITNSTFFRCIEYLDLSRNLLNGKLLPAAKNMYMMENLKYLDLSRGTKLSFSISHKYNTTKRGGVYFPIPPNLSYVNLSRSANANHVRISLTLTQSDHLSVLDFSRNDLLDIPSYLKCCKNLNLLDISHMKISQNVFNNTNMVTNLQILLVHDVTSDDDMFVSPSEPFFNVMPKLTRLDLSGNNLQLINKNTLRNFNKLENLSLARNRLDDVAEDLLMMARLKHLDMTSNSLSVIRKQQQTMLDDFVVNNGSFYLYLTGNIFSCSCGTLHFIQWLLETDVTLDHHGNYSCILGDGTLSDTASFYASRTFQWRTCVGQFWLAVAIVGNLVALLSLLVAFLFKKYFPKIEHRVLDILGYNPRRRPQREDFDYDAYICYESAEYHWPCHCLFKELPKVSPGIRLYLPDLHDPVGCSQAEVTINTLSRSWKIVIVLTENFLRDEWIHFTVLSIVRLMSVNNAITDRVLLLYRDMPLAARARVPRLLLNVVSEEHILDVEEHPQFWTHLCQRILNADPAALF
ncbi:CD180 antigen-like [Haliotis rufescens]|uniref:CD180 antigen-like n=1 Tax=Haliotis rufescens TaxID=6454 RepID=UPI00201F967A|nr:CD180 antigen-like [Haliotis rufescens]